MGRMTGFGKTLRALDDGLQQVEDGAWGTGQDFTVHVFLSIERSLFEKNQGAIREKVQGNEANGIFRLWLLVFGLYWVPNAHKMRQSYTKRGYKSDIHQVCSCTKPLALAAHVELHLATCLELLLQLL